MSPKKDRRIARTEDAIMQAGIQTLLSDRSAGMSEIARNAGIGRATLYRHFETREALVKKLALNCYREIDLAFAPHEHLTGKAAIEKIFSVAMPMAQRFIFLDRLWSFVEHDKDVQRLDAKAVREMNYLFDQAKSSGEIDKTLPNAWLSALFDSVLMAGWTLVEAGEVSEKQAAELAARSFFRGCSTLVVL